MFEYIDVEVDDGRCSVHFRFLSMENAMNFVKTALITLMKEETHYHEPGITLTIKEVENKKEETEEETEEDEE